MAQAAEAAVIGGGSFGTALACLLGGKGLDVCWWMRDPTQSEACRRIGENERYFPGKKIPGSVVPTSDLEKAVRGARVVFVCVPSRGMRQIAGHLGAHTIGSQILVSTSKGIEEKSFKMMSQVLSDETCCLKVGALSGPNLAGEIMEEIPTGSVIASRFDEVIEAVDGLLAGRTFRVYGNRDLFGVELGGALKNIYAIASGLISAMAMGDNTRAMLMTRGLAEMSRFAIRLGADPMTFLGLSGVGDLIVTCSSHRSRNFQVGYKIARGSSLEAAVRELGQVAEGVGTLKIIHYKAEELNVRLPIAEGLYQLLYLRRPLRDVLEELMAIGHRQDVEFVAR